MSTRYLNLALERSPVGMGIRKVDQWVSYSDFTDGGSTSGTLSMTKQIPAGSFVLGSKVTVTTGFTGDTSCVLDIGTSGDADAYSYTAHNIYSTATNKVSGADSASSGSTGCGLSPVSEATTVVLTATSGTDWTKVTAGKMYVEVFYLSTNPEITESYANKLGETI